MYHIAQRRPNVFDVGPTLYNVLCLLGTIDECLVFEGSCNGGKIITWKKVILANIMSFNEKYRLHVVLFVKTGHIGLVMNPQRGKMYRMSYSLLKKFEKGLSALIFHKDSFADKTQNRLPGPAKTHSYKHPSKQDTLKLCWFNVAEAGPTLNQHLFNVSCNLSFILALAGTHTNVYDRNNDFFLIVFYLRLPLFCPIHSSANQSGACKRTISTHVYLNYKCT